MESLLIPYEVIQGIYGYVKQSYFIYLTENLLYKTLIPC